MKAPTMTIRVQPELEEAIKALAEATDEQRGPAEGMRRFDLRGRRG